MSTEVVDVGLAGPRDRAGPFGLRLVLKGSRRGGGLDEMIISLYTGGMTVRDISHHLARTLGTELSRDTISKITDGPCSMRLRHGSRGRWTRSTRSSTSPL